MNETDKLLDRLAEPSLASILLSIGVLGILYELAAPGVGLGGIVGVISLLLGLSGMSVLPLNMTGVLLMLAGVAALGLELHVPTHGVVGFGGVVAMVVGGLMLIDETSYFGAVPHIDWHTQVPIVLLIGALLLLLAAQAARALEAKPITGPGALIGGEGDVSDAFAPEDGEFGGMVRLDGTYWHARSNVPLELGARIEVLEVSTRPMCLRVQRARKGHV
jgi:membrane-bound serine protease (ClpP class)